MASLTVQMHSLQANLIPAKGCWETLTWKPWLWKPHSSLGLRTTAEGDLPIMTEAEPSFSIAGVIIDIWNTFNNKDSVVVVNQSYFSIDF